MTNAMTAIASRERNPTQHSTAMSRATLREAAYRSKLPLLEGPNRPTTEKPALTSALTVVTMAQVQKRRIMSTHLRWRVQGRWPGRGPRHLRDRDGARET